MCFRPSGCIYPVNTTREPGVSNSSPENNAAELSRQTFSYYRKRKKVKELNQQHCLRQGNFPRLINLKHHFL
jgi:hypothetical protein